MTTLAVGLAGLPAGHTGGRGSGGKPVQVDLTCLGKVWQAKTPGKNITLATSHYEIHIFFTIVKIILKTDSTVIF